jgi:hypothetical protein
MLTAAERERCQEMVRVGEHPARSSMHARVLLKADSGPQGPGWTDKAISVSCGVSTVTVATLRKTLVSEGLEAALAHYRCSEREYPRKLDGHQEAHLIALACSDPPAGRDCWSLRLLAGRMVELGHVESLSYNTVRDVLKKRPAALAQHPVVHPAPRRRPLRSLYGGHPGRLLPSR